MPVTFNRKGSGAYETDTYATRTWNHVLDGSENLVIVVICPGLNASLQYGNDRIGPNDIDLKFGGVPMNFLASSFRVGMFYLDGIQGSELVQVSLTPLTHTYTWAANSMSFRGVGEIGTPNSTTQMGSAHTVTTLGPKDGMVAFGVGETYASTLNSYSGATLAFWTNTSGNNSAGGFYAASDGITASTVSASGSTNWGGAIGVPLFPANNTTSFLSMF